MAIISLAYKYVAVALMVAEMNYSADHLALSIKTPITGDDIKSGFVADPNIVGLGGCLNTEEYYFSFVGEHKSPSGLMLPWSGRLCFIGKINKDGGFSPDDYFKSWSERKTTLNTNDAYHIAKGWVVTMGIDVTSLESNCPVVVSQWTVLKEDRNNDNNSDSVLVPLFEVKWGDWNDPKVSAWVGGAGELLRFRQDDDSFSKRSPPWKRNIADLLKVPDVEFLKYSPKQRADLIAKFAAFRYPFITNYAIRTNNGATNAGLSEKLESIPLK